MIFLNLLYNVHKGNEFSQSTVIYGYRIASNLYHIVFASVWMEDDETFHLGHFILNKEWILSQ